MRNLTSHVLGTLVLLALVLPASAAIKTWTGAANDGNWQSNANWGGSAFPTGGYYTYPNGSPNDDLVFGPGASGTTSVANMPSPGNYHKTITFKAGSPAFTLSGGFMGIDAGITVEAGVTVDQNVNAEVNFLHYSPTGVFTNNGSGTLFVKKIIGHDPWGGSNTHTIRFNGNGDFSVGSIANHESRPTDPYYNVEYVEKNGSGTLWITDGADPSLDHDAGYLGSTVINAGKLIVTNTRFSATGRSSVSVAANATLGGTGIITPFGSAAVSLTGGSRLEPGTDDVNGTLTIGLATDTTVLTLGNNVTAAFDFDGTEHDAIRLHGDLVLGGTVNLVLRGVEALAPGTYTFLDYDDNAITASEFDALTYNVTGLPDSEELEYLLVHDQENSQIHLQIIPSPAAVVLLIPGLALMVGRRPVGRSAAR
jgi:hypothetical protein